MPDRKSVIIVAGPTASGKTDYAFTLAKKFNTSIISADSRQCYKELNIGVAKPANDILEQVPHYFINSHSIFENVNAHTFEDYALNAAKRIFENHDTIVMAGGTGLYIRAFMEGLDTIPEVDVDLENAIRKEYNLMGRKWLKEQLMENDPVFAVKGEMKNPQRMMRALVVKLSTGKSILEFHASDKKQRPFGIQKIFIDVPRGILYQRIDRRVDDMMAAGLLAEAENLFPHRSLNALQTVGYSELFDYFENKISLDRAVELIKQNTRHYARRQMTWFRKYFVDEETTIIH